MTSQVSAINEISATEIKCVKKKRLMKAEKWIVYGPLL